MLRDPETKAEVYFNKRTGTYTNIKPMTFNDSRVELLEFETITGVDGNLVQPFHLYKCIECNVFNESTPFELMKRERYKK